MTSEPLTVDELERQAKELGRLLLTYYTSDYIREETDARKAILIMLPELNNYFGDDLMQAALLAWFKSHSRQLWLEAARISGTWHGEEKKSATPWDGGYDAGWNDCADDLATNFRAKAESTPKPSPALPSQESK